MVAETGILGAILHRAHTWAAASDGRSLPVATNSIICTRPSCAEISAPLTDAAARGRDRKCEGV